MKKIIIVIIILVGSAFNSSSLAEIKDVKEINLRSRNLYAWKNIFNEKYKDYLLLIGYKNVQLFNMKGELLNTWFTAIKRARFLKNCHLIYINDHHSREITEVDYKSKILWQFKAPGITHHDFEFTQNGNLILLYMTSLDKDFPIENGCKNFEVIADSILEVNRDGENKFEWFFHKNYTPLLNADKCSSYRRARMAKSQFSPNLLDWAHPNSINVLKENKWYKKGYKEFKPGNILVTIHHFDRAIIIDKDNGRVVWVYKGDQLNLEGPHEAKMIPEGLPGAGNILIFDNGLKRKYSRVLEIDPVSKKTLWSYQKPGEFFNKWAGSQQRLKNGDTFISDDRNGRVFIVNKKGQIKWQFLTKDAEEIKRASLYLRDDHAHCLSQS